LTRPDVHGGDGHFDVHLTAEFGERGVGFFQQQLAQDFPALRREHAFASTEMGLGLERAALSKVLANAAHRGGAITQGQRDLAGAPALLVKFENLFSNDGRYGFHAANLLCGTTYHYIWEGARSNMEML
jgi:hypothetical protein